MSLDKEHPDFRNLKKRIRENPGDFVAIVGAGLSKPCGIPTWGGLRDLLVKEGYERTDDQPVEERDGYKQKILRLESETNPWSAFGGLKNILPKQAYERVVMDALTVVDKTTIPTTYDRLWQLEIRGIVTYNLDSCAIDSHSRVRDFAADQATGKDASRFAQFLPGSQPFVFQPHGQVSDSSTWVFTPEERSRLLHRETYKDFMRTLWQSKHLLILGLNPEDYAFIHLREFCSGEEKPTGPQHYMFLESPKVSIREDVGNYGIAVIPYTTEDEINHPELEEAFVDLLAHLPRDGFEPTVFEGSRVDVSELPTDDELVRMPTEKLRQLLNGAISAIIPKDSTPTRDDIDKLSDFYSDPGCVNENETDFTSG